MGRCPELPASLETNTCNPVFFPRVLGSALAVHRALMFGKIAALVQGPGTTYSNTLAFPACFGFHTIAWEMEMSVCLEICFSPTYV